MGKGRTDQLLVAVAVAIALLIVLRYGGTRPPAGQAVTVDQSGTLPGSAGSGEEVGARIWPQDFSATPYAPPPAVEFILRNNFEKDMLEVREIRPYLLRYLPIAEHSPTHRVEISAGQTALSEGFRTEDEIIIEGIGGDGKMHGEIFIERKRGDFSVVVPLNAGDTVSADGRLISRGALPPVPFTIRFFAGDTQIPVLYNGKEYWEISSADVVANQPGDTLAATN